MTIGSASSVIALVAGGIVLVSAAVALFRRPQSLRPGPLVMSIATVVLSAGFSWLVLQVPLAPRTLLLAAGIGGVAGVVGGALVAVSSDPSGVVGRWARLSVPYLLCLAATQVAVAFGSAEWLVFTIVALVTTAVIPVSGTVVLVGRIVAGHRPVGHSPVRDP